MGPRGPVPPGLAGRLGGGPFGPGGAFMGADRGPFDREFDGGHGGRPQGPGPQVGPLGMGPPDGGPRFRGGGLPGMGGPGGGGLRPGFGPGGLPPPALLAEERRRREEVQEALRAEARARAAEEARKDEARPAPCPGAPQGNAPAVRYAPFSREAPRPGGTHMWIGESVLRARAASALVHAPAAAAHASEAGRAGSGDMAEPLGDARQTTALPCTPASSAAGRRGAPAWRRHARRRAGAARGARRAARRRRG